MANSDNKCADLEINDHFTGTEDTLGLLLESQRNFQTRLGFDFNGMTLKQIAEFWMVNKHAMTDELNEMFDALGGIEDGIGSAAWKYWKSDNSKAADMTIDDLSEKDRLELYYEWIDGLKFYLNFAISIGLVSKDMVNLFMSKSAENYSRQERGY